MICRHSDHKVQQYHCRIYSTEKARICAFCIEQGCRIAAVHFPADTRIHGFEVQCCGYLHGCDCGGDSGRNHCMDEIRAAEYK
jgi:hypothetical protein